MPATFQIIARPITDPTRPVEYNDTLVYPRTLPDGSKVHPGEMACNYPGAVGVPASFFVSQGFEVLEPWLCEVRDHHIVRHVAHVLGAAYAVEEKPNFQT